MCHRCINQKWGLPIRCLNEQLSTKYKDDEIIAFGSSLECTEKLGLKNVRQFYALISKARSGLRHHYDIVVEETDENAPD